MEVTERLYELCKQCYVKEVKPKKKMVKHILLSFSKEPCACCGKMEKLVIGFDNEKE